VSANSHPASVPLHNGAGLLFEIDTPITDSQQASNPLAQCCTHLSFPQRNSAVESSITHFDQAPPFPDLSQKQPASGSDSHSASKLNPTNYVSLFRASNPQRRLFSRSNASIKGTFTVNPFLHIPSELLSPLGHGEREADRKNLRLQVENGGIDVDINLVGDASTSPRPPNALTRVFRTTLELSLCGGSNNIFPLIAKIHTPTLLRPPFHLTATSINGFVSLYLPRSFHGLIMITVSVGDLNNHITLSPKLGDYTIILSETSKTRGYFVGALGDWAKEGDRVDLTVNKGRLHIQYEGEKDLDKIRQVGWQVMGL